jgi:TetR/AcrR family transcriptional regulator, fatty acid metabolism regulator protein
MFEKHRPNLTFIEETRRKQIIDSAIQIIARNGFQNTSLDDIAENVNVSKGVITYHFASKTDLIHSILQFIIEDIRSNRLPCLQKQLTALEKLRAYIRADFDYFKNHPDTIITLVELWGSLGSRQEKQAFEKATYVPGRTLLQEILSDGQSSGEFGKIDPYSSACVLQGAIDGIMLQWVFNPDRIDFDRACEEVCLAFERRLVPCVIKPEEN